MSMIMKCIALDWVLTLCLSVVVSYEERVTVCRTFNTDTEPPPKCEGQTVFMTKSNVKHNCPKPLDGCTKEKIDEALKKFVEEFTKNFTTRLDRLSEKVDQATNKLSGRASNVGTSTANKRRSNGPFNKGCQALYAAGITSDGVYNITINENSVSLYCDMEVDGGGWTVFQKRNLSNGMDFNRIWSLYKHGFSNLGLALGKDDLEFWLGLDSIHALTRNQKCKLRIDVWDSNNNHQFATYSNFAIANESDYYRLYVSGYSGTAGDGLNESSNGRGIHNDMRFSTKDKDKDRFGLNCAASHEGGWWFDACYDSCLNCRVASLNWNQARKQSSTMMFRCD